MDYRQVMPKDYSDFLDSLTEKDKKDIMTLARNYNIYKDEKDGLLALKIQKPDLGKRAEKLTQDLHNKINSLSSEPKAFALELYAGAKKLLAQSIIGVNVRKEFKEKAVLIRKKYNDLTEDHKGELMKVFPVVSKAMESEGFRRLIESM